ncbi:DUF222 domain-containing protein [Paramicrobacterium sp. CJ85]|uniref:HNH endonuclease signature motif containing protein n=1 Tax=Paramicrobacterium sp. CJ85 TaxID=3445355 RepID=UPI003F602D82
MSTRTSPTFMNADELADRGQEPEPRSRPQERADVFTAIIAGVGKHDSTPKLHGRGPTVLVTVDERNLNTGTGAAWSPGSPAPLPVSFVKQMQCDGDTNNVDIDAHGEVLNLGRTERFFTPKQRLAMIARDGSTCVIPDCPIPAWLCEAHHVLGWENGGTTDLPNGVLICWWHHRLVEHGEWTLTRDDNGHPKLTPPDWFITRDYLGRREPMNGTSTPSDRTSASSGGSTASDSQIHDDDGDPPASERHTVPRS